MELLQRYHPRDLNHLELLASQVVEGFIVGLHKSPFHGFSVEFAEHRLYNPGESTRDIDWKVYARTDKLFSKKYEEETNLRCQVVIDTSSSMYFPEKDRPDDNNFNKLQFSILGAAALMNLLRKQRDAYGLTLFDDHIHTATACKSNMAHYKLMLTHLDRVYSDNTLNKSTSAAKAIHEIAESIHKRSLVIIFSDMFEYSSDLKELFSALQHLKFNKHEVIVFHVHDRKYELDFEYGNRPYLFIDMETGEKLRLQPKEVEELYTSKIKNYIKEIQTKCIQYKIDFIPADINEGYRPILQSYLLKRSKMNI